MNSFDNDVVQLIERMVDAFQQKKGKKKISNRIQRGRALASSSEFEEELAKLIEKYTPNNIELRVDFPLSFRSPSAKRAKTIYPDIAVIRSKSLIGILEAKIDLGYLSPDWAGHRKQILNELKSAGEVKANGEQLTIPTHLLNANIILSARNCRAKLENFKNEAENTIVIISSKHLHPNDGTVIKESYIKGIKDDEDIRTGWRKLEHFINNL